MATALPYDLWEHVARYLPMEAVKGLYSLNSALFHIAMDARYRIVEFEGFDDEKMRLLDRVRDPAIGRRITILRMETWSVFTSHHRRGKTIFTSDEIILAMEQAVTAMRNLRELHVTSKNHLFCNDLVPFFCLAWRTFGRQLQKLSLDASLTRLRTLLSDTPEMKALTHFELNVDNDNSPLSFIDRKIQADLLAPFINGLAPTLEHLTISSHHDLSILVESINLLPRMTYFRLKAPLSISSSIHITRLLSSHSNVLRFFSWSPDSAATGSEAPAILSWLQANLEDHMVLANMQALHLNTSLNSAELLLAYVKRSASSLVDLNLIGTFMSYGEMEEFVDLFIGSDSLLRLGLSTSAVTPRAIALLANLPSSLKELKLQFRTVIDDTLNSESDRRRPPPRLSKLDLVNLHHLSPTDFRIVFDAIVHNFSKSTGKSDTFNSGANHSTVLGAFESMRKLTFTVHTLSPYLLDYLALHFPGLEELAIFALGMAVEVDQDAMADNGSCVTTFAHVLKSGPQPRFSSWRNTLEKIDVSVRCINGSMLMPWEIMDVGNVVVRTMKYCMTAET